MKTRTIVMLILWFVILTIAVAGLLYLTLFTDTICYTQVDNARVTEIVPRGGMYYRYELPGYDAVGHQRTLSFETARLLREDAWLLVKVAPIRGVTAWEEVQPEAIPEGAWEKLGGTESDK